MNGLTASLHALGRAYGFDPAALPPEAAAAMLALVRERDQALAASERDPLTGALNRRGFMRALARAAAEAERYGVPAWLLVLDLDGFKAVNDRYGHAAGDRALQEVAARLVARVRESDAIARIGGDEFVALLTHVSASEAARKAEALVAAIEAVPAQLGEAAVPLRASVGLARLDPGIHPERALAAADAAMYARKAERRAAAG